MISLRKKSMPTGATFTSYVSNNGDSLDNFPDKEKDRSSRFFGNQKPDDFDLKVNLLPGELVITEAAEVHRFISYTEGCRGNTGTLYVTNFKVSFVTVDLNELCNQNQASQMLVRKNKLLGANDIALTSICDLYQELKGKRKRLQPCAMLPTVNQKFPNLEIFCKDFQTHIFSFNGDREKSRSVVNAILHHAFPAQPDLFFAFSFKRPMGVSTRSLSDSQDEYITGEVKHYMLESDWQTELERLNVSGFRITNCNHAFKLSSSVPECFVIPESLSDSVMREQKCFPVWSYTHRSGTSLVRVNRSEENETQIMCHIKASHPKNRKGEIVDLNSPKYNLPALKDLQTSIEKLREACMRCTTKDVTTSDSGSVTGWFSALEESKWLAHVSNSLYVVSHVVDRMAFENRSVLVVEGDGGRDFSPLVCSLAQLCMDPWCRTLQGFQDLVEREWMALSHPFRTRCFYSNQSKDEQSPIFLLFLDCVWQLLRQFPSSFQFNTVFLTSLYDSVSMGIFHDFVVNNVMERAELIYDFRASDGCIQPPTTNRQSSSSNTLPHQKSPPMYKILPGATTPLTQSLPANQGTQSYKILPSVQSSSSGAHMLDRSIPFAEISVSNLAPYNYSEEVTTKVLSVSTSSMSDSSYINNQSPTGTQSAPGSLANSNASKNSMHVWDWLIQFSGSDVNSFSNPLYIAADTSRRLRAKDRRYNSLSVNAMQDNKVSLHTGRYVCNTNRILRLVEDALQPCASVSCLKIWDHCYLRWFTPLVIANGGGEMAEIFAQKRTLREIELLQKEISKYKGLLDCETSSLASQGSEVWFDDAAEIRATGRVRKRDCDSRGFDSSQEGYDMSAPLAEEEIITRDLLSSPTLSDRGINIGQNFDETLRLNETRSLESHICSSYPYLLPSFTNTVPFIATDSLPVVDSNLAAADDSASVYDEC